jgi:hypothetical protein
MAANIARITATSAIRLNTALVACEYSHRVRSASQFGGSVVQFCVCLLTGNVNVQKISCVIAIEASAVAA